MAPILAAVPFGRRRELHPKPIFDEPSLRTFLTGYGAKTVPWKIQSQLMSTGENGENHGKPSSICRFDVKTSGFDVKRSRFG